MMQKMQQYCLCSLLYHTLIDTNRALTGIAFPADADAEYMYILYGLRDVSQGTLQIPTQEF